MLPLAERLLVVNLVQGGRRVIDYSIEFRTLGAESDWNSSLLTDAFYNGLSDTIKDELAARDPPVDLDTLIAMANRIDRRLQERRRERALTSTPRSFPRPPSPPSSVLVPSSITPGDFEEPKGPHCRQLNDSAAGGTTAACTVGREVITCLPVQ